jgi:hypothetical protein
MNFDYQTEQLSLSGTISLCIIQIVVPALGMQRTSTCDIDTMNSRRTLKKEPEIGKGTEFTINLSI